MLKVDNIYTIENNYYKWYQSRFDSNIVDFFIQLFLYKD